MKENWDLETDVLVVGYGLAGGVAAVAAHDAGAEVLVVEKSQHPGGCSILSGGQVKCAAEIEGAIQYLTAISGGRMQPDMIRAFAEALADNEAFIRQLASVVNAEIRRVPGKKGIYPLPGRESLYAVRVGKIPCFSGFDWLPHQGGVNLMRIIMSNIEARSVPVHLSTPACRLLTDGADAIVGAVVLSEGQEVAVRARRGVILATGGFEQNESMRQHFLQGTPFYSMAPLTHTGDGITMALKVGAALWHMWHVHGSYGFKPPDSPFAFRHPFPGIRNPKRKMPWIVVDRFGGRYMNEYPPAPQDTGHRAMEFFDADLPGFPRIPSYMIFDTRGCRMGPVAKPKILPGQRYDWSHDNSREIEKGWIVQAPSIRELAIAIRQRCPQNEARMDAERLHQTVKEWNRQVKVGNDPFNRPAGTMMPILESPFFAVEVWPIITNTQGGPIHNANQEIIDPFGEPIPGLYSVGELGSFFGHLYELEGNLAECLTSGRIAGRNAASRVQSTGF